MKYPYSCYGYTRGGGKIWHGGIDVCGLDDDKIRIPYMMARTVTAPPETFWCVMCMMYSDYYKVARAHGVDTPEFYADMAAAFLNDEDAAPNKAGRYYHCVAEG